MTPAEQCTHLRAALTYLAQATPEIESRIGVRPDRSDWDEVRVRVQTRAATIESVVRFCAPMPRTRTEAEASALVRVLAFVARTRVEEEGGRGDGSVRWRDEGGAEYFIFASEAGAAALYFNGYRVATYWPMEQEGGGALLEVRPVPVFPRGSR